MAVEDLWELWTDTEKVTRWLSGGATIDLRVGGTYELKGHLAGRPFRDVVGGPILSLEEEYVLKVAWQFPTEFGTAVHAETSPTTLGVWFQPLGPNRTRLRLEHDGWKDGPDWTRVRQWQTETWTAVIERLGKGNLPG